MTSQPSIRLIFKKHFNIDLPISGENGRTLKNAIIIHRIEPNDYVSIEYAFLKYMALGRKLTYEIKAQNLLESNNRTYDVLEITTNKEINSNIIKNTEKYYFDITECLNLNYENDNVEPLTENSSLNSQEVKRDLKNEIEKNCYSCSHYNASLGVCNKIHENVRSYPTKFIKKCDAKFFNPINKNSEKSEEAEAFTKQYDPNKSVYTNEVYRPHSYKSNERILNNDLSEQPHPWLRYWARLFDIMLSGFGLGFVLTFIAPKILTINDTILGLICLFVWVFIESFFLSTWGTTPGKKLFKIHLYYGAGTKIPYSEALNRSFQVWLGGFGAGIPIISLVTLISAHNKLKKNGKTSWDQSIGYTVRHEKIGILRTILIIFIFLIFLVLIGYGNSDY